MLPAFDEHGNLPAGIHPCSVEELISRFGSGSPERAVEIAELTEFIAWAKNAGVARVIVNGSFVTAREAPNDVDVIILPGVDYPRDQPRVGTKNTSGRSCKSSSQPMRLIC
jgi:hydroxymethylpyrimidine/phosphomethylpyrimidine kinase